MELVKAAAKGQELILAVSGCFDLANADAIEQAFMYEIGKHLPAHITLDLEALTSLSDAGLQVIQRLHEREPLLHILNVSPEIYEIFKTAGLTDTISVEKAYRKIQIDDFEVIGNGAKSKVFRMDPGTIVKYYFDADSLPDIQRERELTRKAIVLGIPTAIPYDVVKIGDGYGSVFERLNADSFAKLLRRDSEHVDAYIASSVDVLKKMHAIEVRPEEIPDITLDAEKWLNETCPTLPVRQGDKLRRLIHSIPRQNTIIHGDYHIKNIMMQNGKVLLIDMDTLSRGNPLYEMAAIYSAYVGFGAFDEENIPSFLGISNELARYIWQKTISLYFETDDADKLADIEKKAKLLSYLKIYRRSLKRGDLEKSIASYKDELIRLINKLDTLEI